MIVPTKSFSRCRMRMIRILLSEEASQTLNSIIGVSLSKPHTSGRALQKCVCVCVGLLAAIYCKLKKRG